MLVADFEADTMAMSTLGSESCREDCNEVYLCRS